MYTMIYCFITKLTKQFLVTNGTCSIPDLQFLKLLLFNICSPREDLLTYWLGQLIKKA